MSRQAGISRQVIFSLIDLEANGVWQGVSLCWITFPSSFNHLFD